MHAVGEDAFLEQLRSMEQRLVALRDVPQQLAAVLESLGQVHVRLHEIGQPAAKEDETMSVHSAHSNLVEGTVPQRKSSNNKPDEALSSHSSAAKERMTVLSGLHYNAGNPTGQRKSSVSSGHPQNLARRPSNLSALSEQRKACTLNAIPAFQKDERRPSVQSEPPEHLKRRPSLSSSISSIREGFQIVQVNATSATSDAAKPSKEGLAPQLRKCLSLGEMNSNMSQHSSLLTLWEHGEPQKHRCFVLLPNEILRLIWDMVVICASIFIGVLIPIELAYFAQPSSGYNSLHAADVVWILDILLNFRTGFYVRGRVVLDPYRIALRYARTWLGVDLLTAWPTVLAPSGGVRIVLVLKLLRLARLGSLFTRLQKEVRFSLLPIRIILGVLLVSHVIACAWRVTHPRSTAKQDSVWHLYVEDTYWVFMTVTTVGYGDVTPTTLHSRLYAIVVMLMAPVFSGTIVSGMTHVTKGLFDGQVERRVQDAVRFMDRHNVPPGLQQRVEQNLRHHLCNKTRMDPELFATLSPAVQRELSLTLLSSTVLRFPLFKNAQHGFVAELARAHIWVSCLPGDIVVEDGQLMQEMFFLVQGRLLVQRRGAPNDGGELDVTSEEGPLKPSEDDILEYEVSTGAWFGESCLFDEDSVHDSTIAATAESELAVLTAREFRRIAEKFPRLMQRHRQIEEAITQKEVSIAQLAYRRGQSEAGGGRRGSILDGVTFLRRSRGKVADSTAWTPVASLG